MNNLWENLTGYYTLLWYVNACTRTCFRRFEVKGLENIPKEGPVIFASNHCNALMDPLVILRAYKKVTCFGTRADLFRKPKTAALLRWLRMVPLARHERDSMESVAHNREVFEEIAELVKHIPFALFVEGTHRTKHSLMKLRKGVFVISDHTLDHGAEQVAVVPVGLDYQDYFRFMSDIKVNFGEPMIYKGGEDKKQLLEELYGRMSKLITFFPDDENYDKAYAEYAEAHKPSRKWWKYVIAVVLLPLFAACGIICSPIIIASELLTARMQDKAWSNTVKLGFRLPFFFIWPFHSAFYLILNFYNSLI